MRLNASVFVVGVAVLVTVLFAGIALSAPTAAAPTPIELASAVSGAPPRSLNATVPNEFVAGDRYADTSTGDEYFIDNQRGAILSYYAGNIGAGAKGPLIAESEILMRSDALLERTFMGSASDRAALIRTVHRNDIPALASPDGAKSSAGYSEVLVQYRLVRNGIRLPTAFSATYDGVSGELLSFVQFSRNVTVPLTPRVPKATAVSVAADAARMPIHELDQAILSVHAPEGEPQRLTWLVRMHNGDAGKTTGGDAKIVVDAVTGDVLTSSW